MISTLALSNNPHSSKWSIHCSFKRSVGTTIKAEAFSFRLTKADIRFKAIRVLPKPVQATIVAAPPDFNQFLRHCF